MFVLPMPHTGVLPHPCSAADVTRLGTVIKWMTDDPVVLKDMHEAIIRIVQDVGVLRLSGAAMLIKAKKQAAKELGMPWSHDEIMRMALWDDFPIPADVLKFTKGFR
jgi:hypothetical protein